MKKLLLVIFFSLCTISKIKSFESPNGRMSAFGSSGRKSAFQPLSKKAAISSGLITPMACTPEPEDQKATASLEHQRHLSTSSETSFHEPRQRNFSTSSDLSSCADAFSESEDESGKTFLEKSAALSAQISENEEEELCSMIGNFYLPKDQIDASSITPATLAIEIPGAHSNATITDRKLSVGRRTKNSPEKPARLALLKAALEATQKAKNK